MPASIKTNEKTLGVILVLFAGLFWGTMGVGAQYLMQRCGFTPMNVSVFRLVGAGFLTILVSKFILHRDMMLAFANWRNARDVVIAGFLVLLSQLTFMISVNESNAGTATILLMLVPLLAGVWGAISQGKFLTRRQGLCFVLAISGVTLLVTKGNFNSLDFSVGGVVWGLVSAFFATCYSIQPRSIVSRIGPENVVGWGMLLSGITLAFFYPPIQPGAEFTPLSISLLLYAIVFGTVLAFLFYLSATKYISAVIMGLLVCTEPLSAYITGIAFLGERLGVAELIGIVLILCNVFILSVASSPKPKKAAA